MKIKITPSKAVGTVAAPPSKSMAHRALICAALAGKSIVKNIDLSADISATLSCLDALGATSKSYCDSIELCKLNPFLIPPKTELFCNESGSTLRFLIPICLLSGEEVTLKGANRLFERPLSIYEDICREQGLYFEKGSDSLKIRGPLKSGNFRVRGDVSSQFISGLLFALPLLDGFSIIEIDGKLESASYIDLTLSVLSDFGINITHVGNRFIIPGNQSYRKNDYTVEGDCSNAAFLEAFNLVGGGVSVVGIKPETLQGDRVYKDIFDGLVSGVREFDLSDCPDLAPVSFAVASLFGDVRFFGTKRLKLKESDRAEAMKQEMKKFGIGITVGENEVYIPKSELKFPNEVLNGHNDHRIVMALSVLCSLVGGEIDGAEAVSKSYPDFFEVIKSLGINVYEA